MNRRSVSVVTAFVLLIGFAALLAYSRVPYVRFKPGLTLDVLDSQAGGRPIVQVDGHATYKTDGELRMTTVSTTSVDQRVRLADALAAWVDPHRDLYPYNAIYPRDITPEDERTESQIEMVSSQDNAVAAALTELGFKLNTRPSVLNTVPGGASEGKLRAHDTIVSINGRPVAKADEVSEQVGALQPGDPVVLEVLRGGKERTVRLVTKAAEDNPKRAVIGIFVGTGYDFPFEVSVNVPERIGGPSAGLIFALAIYDTLTPGSLTGGVAYAGTGTIDENGRVGPIGGIRQKIAGAEDDGAEVFLVPPDNCDEALAATTDLKLVRTDSMHAAVEALEAYAENKSALLPTCDQEVFP